MRLLRFSRTGWLVLLVAVQTLLLGFTLAFFAAIQDEVRMEQEVHPEEVSPRPHLPARELLDTASFLAGPELLGIELPTELRRGLSFAPGQMLWLVLDRSLAGEDPLVREARKLFPTEEASAKLREGLQDGVLNFLYDLGGRRDLALQNWSGVAVRELQASPLLPWAKHLDFLVLSSLADSAVGGLGFVTERNPDVLLVVPTCAEARLRTLSSVPPNPHLLVLPEGLHPLAPRLWALVLAAPAASGHPAELDLVLERRDGSLVILAGSGLNPPSVPLRKVRELLGRDAALYAGATPWNVGWDSSGLEAEVTALTREFPTVTLVPNGDTSLVAHGVLEALLGPRYRPGRLGTRVRL